MRRASLIVLVAAAAFLASHSAGAPAASAATTCKLPLNIPFGWEAIFGTRPTRSGAESLRVKATRVGFKSLVIERPTCTRWAVALHGLTSKRQGRQLAAEAKPAGFNVVLKCRPVLDLDGDWQAVFGYYKTRQAAEKERVAAGKQGFRSLLILRNICTRKWYVELDGLKSLRQARAFQSEAKHAGFAVTIKHH